MSGKNVPVIVVPRFTGYAGDGQYLSEPMPVAAYSKITLDLWHGPMIGSGVLSIGVLFQESNDLATWFTCGGGPWFIPAGQSETQVSADLSRAWFQFGVVVHGTNAGLTCWAQGFFEARER